MKTLDEVIIALEVCTYGYCSHPKYGDCPYLDKRNNCDTRQRKLDALEYLKKLKRIEAKIEKIAVGNIEDTLSKMDNPPITWDELRTMEGKPVWVEFLKDGESYDEEWIIIQDINDECMGDTQRFAYQKVDYGDKWQAYRNERK